jgi:hypothetical protein
VPKSKVSGNYYETHSDTAELIASFNESIEMLRVPELEEKALKIIREWEQKYLNK